MTTDDEIIALVKENFYTGHTSKITVKNGLVSCDDDVTLDKTNLTMLPVVFEHVGGTFSISWSQLMSLNGSPKSIDGNFYCKHTQIKNLQGGPIIVKGNYKCSDNNQLVSLLGAPKITQDFNCDRTSIRNLLGAPQQVYGNFNCVDTGIESFKNAPKIIEGKLLTDYYPNVALLPILEIKALQAIGFYDIDSWDNENQEWLEQTDHKLAEILNRYLGTGTQGMLPCADEMIEAGYGSNAHYD